ncbi:eukaryotic translation initiation factor 1 [Dictyostelium discoideum AX4]|uniref:Eukaryotic translation initiation factor 1 n=1 Tax=Dictyostelium discoideum TaxID=44689 RepID=Q86AU4_DICDI|nr:eukaryotic translation initiation factor 1 [Dictyostelium discoideum AX4]EAL70012.1 eukaryotic translation initiation factor 1 [Dictyostelium discoideum AX4]|eukprot:XP_644059.1 eukaryotic translation initiation factor 1 [Dictyostelium discoideum AX4]
MSSIQNLNSADPFAEDSNLGGDSGISYVHIRIFQRSGRKAVTTVEGLPPKIDLKKILKHLKKSLNCNGNIVEEENLGMIIKLQGDKRKEIALFLIEEKISQKPSIKIHGF